MGHIDRVLGKIETSPKTHYYNDFFTIEVCENFHIHWRNMRMQFTDKEFEVFAEAMMKAYKLWKIMGKPYPYKETIYLSPAWKDLPDEQIFRNEIKVEQQVKNPNLPEIHFHYKNIRLDLNTEELKELKKMFEEMKI